MCDVVYSRILIDTGDGEQPEYFANLNKALEEEQKGARIASVLLTHWHHDHVGGVNHILDKFKPVTRSRIAINMRCFIVEQLVAQAKVLKYPRQDSGDPELPQGWSYEHVKDGQLLEVEGASLEVVYTPGHTTDHVILYLKVLQKLE